MRFGVPRHDQQTRSIHIQSMYRRLLRAAGIHFANPLRDAIPLLRTTSRNGEHPAYLVHDYELIVLMNDLQQSNFTHNFPHD